MSPKDNPDFYPSMSGLKTSHFSLPSAGLVLGGQFELVEQLGAGAYGLVWKARDRYVADRFVCIKLLPPELQSEPVELARVRQMFSRVHALQHENLCPLYLLGDDARFKTFIVMKYLEGVTLGQYAAQYRKVKGPLPIKLVLGILSKVAAALDYVHKQGLVHRDIKPANIMVNAKTGDVQVVDLGLAAEIRSSMSRVSKSGGDVTGTAPYMAPEQWRGLSPDGRADQYSLGVVAYELLAGHLPFDAPNSLAWMNCALNETPPPLTVEYEGLSDAILQAMAKGADARYSSCIAFVQSLQKRSKSAASGSTIKTPELAIQIAGGPREPTTTNPPIDPTDRKMKEKKRQDQLLLPGKSPTGTLEHDKNRRQLWLIAVVGGAFLAIGVVISILANLDRSADYRVSSGDAQTLELKSPPTRLVPRELKAPFSSATAKMSQQEWATYLGREVIETNSIGMRLILIPPGEFLMGSNQQEADQAYEELKSAIIETVMQDWFDAEVPSHEVRLTKPFHLGEAEVTRGEFRRFVDATGYQTEAEVDGEGGWGLEKGADGPSTYKRDPKFSWRDSGFEQSDSHPVVNVSSNDALAFCQWLSVTEGKAYRLPTEAEWEFACRAGSTSRFSFGDDAEAMVRFGNIIDASFEEAGWDSPFGRPVPGKDGFVFTSPVRSFVANPWGLFDMHGNVWEWCSDWYGADYYKRSPRTDPQGASQVIGRVIRGGGWCFDTVGARSAARGGFLPVTRTSFMGFRVACSVE